MNTSPPTTDASHVHERPETTTARWLLASAAVASLAGVVLPAYWVPWAEAGHDAQPFILPVVALLLAAHLASVVRLGFLWNRPGRGLALAAADIVVAVVATLATWFMVTPAAIVGLWLLIAAFGLVAKTSPVKKSLVTTACVVIVVSLATSLVLPWLPAYGALAAAGVQSCLTVWLALLCCTRGIARHRTMHDGGT